jgi:hypothetical protein
MLHIVWLSVLAAPLGCTPHVSAALGDLCTGSVVRQERTLVLDTVSTAATATLAALAGRRYRIALRLAPIVTPRDCGNASGEANYDAHLPPELAAGVATDGTPTWLLLGPEIVVDFNPAIANRRLEIRLPLDGGTGHWTLTSPAGELAGGRVLNGQG